MPDLSGDKFPDKEFVINVGRAFNHPNNSTVNTLIPDLLQDMIKRALEAREVKYTSRRNIKMRILPEFKRMFDETKEVCSKNLFWSKIIGCNGRFYQFVRNTSRRRRNRQEKEQIGQKYEEIKQEVTEKDEVIQSLKRQVESFERLEIENDRNSEILAKLFESKVIDENGELMGVKEKSDKME